MKPTFRDNAGKTLAHEHNPTATRHELRSRSGQLLAWHDKNTSRTYDKAGMSVGSGDQTARFIPHDK
jgi:hypothetical protein